MNERISRRGFFIAAAAAVGAVEKHGMADGLVQPRRGADAAGKVLACLEVLFRNAAHGGS